MEGLHDVSRETAEHANVRAVNLVVSSTFSSISEIILVINIVQMAHPIFRVDGNKVYKFVGKDCHGLAGNVDAGWPFGHEEIGGVHGRFGIWIACHSSPQASRRFYVS